MGLTVNPISNRLNISIFWKSKWCTYSNYNYKYLVLSDLIFFKFLSILEKSIILKKLSFIIEGWYILYHNAKFFFFFKYRSFYKKKITKASRKRKMLKRRYTPQQRYLLQINRLSIFLKKCNKSRLKRLKQMNKFYFKFKDFRESRTVKRKRYLKKRFKEQKKKFKRFNKKGRRRRRFRRRYYKYLAIRKFYKLKKYNFLLKKCKFYNISYYKKRSQAKILFFQNAFRFNRRTKKSYKKYKFDEKYISVYFGRLYGKVRKKPFYEKKKRGLHFYDRFKKIIIKRRF